MQLISLDVNHLSLGYTCGGRDASFVEHTRTPVGKRKTSLVRDSPRMSAAPHTYGVWK